MPKLLRLGGLFLADFAVVALPLRGATVLTSGSLPGMDSVQLLYFALIALVCVFVFYGIGLENTGTGCTWGCRSYSVGPI